MVYNECVKRFHGDNDLYEVYMYNFRERTMNADI